VGNFSRYLPELFSLKGYFEALTERDRFIAQIDQALEPWDIWLTPLRQHLPLLIVRLERR